MTTHKDVDPGVFRELYQNWVRAIAEKDYGWFEKHLSEDFSATAHMWPTLRLDKQQFIELDKQIVDISADWQSVYAVPLGRLVVTVADLRMHREVFRTDTAISGSNAAGEDIASLTSGSEVTGKLVSYIGVWKRHGDIWQIVDHRMIDAVD